MTRQKQHNLDQRDTRFSGKAVIRQEHLRATEQHCPSGRYALRTFSPPALREGNLDEMPHTVTLKPGADKGLKQILKMERHNDNGRDLYDAGCPGRHGRA